MSTDPRTNKEKLYVFVKNYIQVLSYFHLRLYPNDAPCEQFKLATNDFFWIQKEFPLVTYTRKKYNHILYFLDDAAGDYYNPNYEHNCGRRYFSGNPKNSSTSEKLILFLNEIFERRSVTLEGKSEEQNEVYARKSSFKQDLMEDASNIDEYHPRLKMAFFPKYCEEKTKIMNLTRNYCGY